MMQGVQHKVSEKPPPPPYDYSDLASWAAFPGQPSPAEFVPDGETPLPDDERPADCFFVHPVNILTIYRPYPTVFPRFLTT